MLRLKITVGSACQTSNALRCMHEKLCGPCNRTVTSLYHERVVSSSVCRTHCSNVRVHDVLSAARGCNRPGGPIVFLQRCCRAPDRTRSREHSLEHRCTSLLSDDDCGASTVITAHNATHNATKWASAIEDTHTRIQQLITRCDNASVMMLTLATVLRRLDEAS